MFGGPRYHKLFTNLKLTVNRLKLLEKKKTELAQKARREISDYLTIGKDDRARIRVESIIREDYLVEAMELVEMFCDLMLARKGLIEMQKEIDPGLEEAIASVIWSTPRLISDVAELKVVSDQLSAKYGKEFVQQCRANSLNNVSERLIAKLNPQAPPKILVEKYLIEIAKTYNVAFTPDENVMRQDECFAADNADDLLINLKDDKNSFGGGGGASGGGGGGGLPVLEPMAPPHPPQPQAGGYPPSQPGFIPMNIPPPGQNTYPASSMPPPPPSYHTPQDPPPRYEEKSGPPTNFQPSDGGPPQLPASPPMGPGSGADTLNLPNVPSGGFSAGSGVNSVGGDDVNFDDLTRRFEALKNKK